MVARRDVADAVADALDDTRTFMAEHRRRIARRVGAGRGVEIGVADAARREPDQDLAGSRLGEVQVLNFEWRSELLENGGADLHEGYVRTGAA